MSRPAGRGVAFVTRRASARGVLLALTLAVVAATVPASAQPLPGRVVKIGYLHIGLISPEPSPERRAFLDQMRTLGYEIGRNLVIEYRGAAMQREMLPDMVEELVSAKVDVIVAVGAEAAKAAKNGTSSVPIVLPGNPDPVSAGLVKSLARPGGNVTGITTMGPDLAGKRLQILKEAFPRTVRVAVLWNAANAGAAREWQRTQETAPKLGLSVRPVEVRSVQDIPAALSTLERERPHALYVVADPMTSVVRQLIVEAAAKQRLPAIYNWREFIDAGGLMAYGASNTEVFRRAAVYVDKILKGAKAGDLPVEQPTKFDLIVNLKTAQALGLTLPPSILVQADEVIR